jgi:hypothetical protein
VIRARQGGDLVPHPFRVQPIGRIREHIGRRLSHEVRRRLQRVDHAGDAEVLIGPDTVNTLPEQTIAAFEDHGSLARTLDTGVDEATEVLRRLAAAGVDMDDVGRTLTDEGVAGFHESFQHLLASLATRARQLSSR